MSRPERIGLSEAAALVPDGSTVYVGNFGAQLHCVGHELIRRRASDLHVVISSGGILLDAMIGAGVVGRATFAHCWGPIGPTPAWNFRRAIEDEGQHERFRELTLGALYAALLAGAWGVPFMPIGGLEGTGYRDADWADGAIGTARSDFGDATVVRALVPDVAFIHADTVDRWGNATLVGPYGDAVVAAQAARTTVVVAEELAQPGEEPREAAIAGAHVDAIVIEPGAVRPDGAADRYGRDVEAYEDYGRRSRTTEGFRDWLEEVVGT